MKGRLRGSPMVSCCASASENRYYNNACRLVQTVRWGYARMVIRRQGDQPSQRCLSRRTAGTTACPQPSRLGHSGPFDDRRPTSMARSAPAGLNSRRSTTSGVGGFDLCSPTTSVSTSTVQLRRSAMFLAPRSTSSSTTSAGRGARKADTGRPGRSTARPDPPLRHRPGRHRPGGPGPRLHLRPGFLAAGDSGHPTVLRDHHVRNFYSVSIGYHLIGNREPASQ